MSKHQLTAALASILLIAVFSHHASARTITAASDDHCEEYYGCIKYEPWPTQPRSRH